jgi:protein-tyrosine phosphatase
MKLSGAYNFRDIGGMRARGSVLRSGRLFRSDTLQELTDADVARLVDELAIAFVIDLRQAAEAVEEGRGPLARSSVCYANVPLVDVDSPAGAPGELTVTQYLDHLDHDPNLVIAVELVASVVHRPTVLHCAAGKDRTGVVTALLLDLLGVDHEQIVADYMVTATHMERITDRFGRWPRYRQNMASLPAEIYRVEEHTIRTFLRELDHRYGGAAGWARARGVDPDAERRLAAALLVDG